MDNYKTGEMIAARRKELGMTQKSLAAKLNISATTVSKWERGVGFPDVSMLVPLSEVLSIGVSELIRGERQPEQTEKEKNAEEKLVQTIVPVMEKKIRNVRKTMLLASACIVVVFIGLMAASFLLPVYTREGSKIPDFFRVDRFKDAAMDEYMTESPLTEEEVLALMNYYMMEGIVSSYQTGGYFGYDYVLPEQADSRLLIKATEGRLVYSLTEKERGILFQFIRPFEGTIVDPNNLLLGRETAGELSAFSLTAYQYDHGYTEYANFWAWADALGRKEDEIVAVSQEEWKKSAERLTINDCLEEAYRAELQRSTDVKETFYENRTYPKRFSSEPLVWNVHTWAVLNTDKGNPAELRISLSEDRFGTILGEQVYLGGTAVLLDRQRRTNWNPETMEEYEQLLLTATLRADEKVFSVTIAMNLIHEEDAMAILERIFARQ